MRLDKFLANMLPLSRKEVNVLVKNGRVLVNGNVQKRADGHIIPETDVITLDGERILYAEYLYLMLNKPKGYVSATEDKKYKTVLDLVPEEFSHYELFPVGRLDIDTEGLLILTNDGQLAHEMLSPKKHVDKVYYAEIDDEVTGEDILAFRKGVTLDDGYHTMPGELVILKSSDISKIELTIKEGKFHQVKRMFEAIGKHVIYLKRIKMGDVPLDETLALGEIRPLSEDEVAILKRKGQSK